MKASRTTRRRTSSARCSIEIEPIEAGGSRLKSSVLKVYPNEVEDNYEENHEPNQPGEVFQCGMLTTSG